LGPWATANYCRAGIKSLRGTLTYDMKKTCIMCVTLTSVAYLAGKSCLVLAKQEKTWCCIAGTAAETGPGEPEAPRHPPTQPKVTCSAQQVSRILYPKMKSLTSLRYTVRPDWI
jgi:hypothetical protein